VQRSSGTGVWCWDFLGEKFEAGMGADVLSFAKLMLLRR